MKLYNDFSKRNGSQPPNDWWGQVMAVMIGISFIIYLVAIVISDVMPLVK